MKKLIVVFICIAICSCEEIVNEENISQESIELLAPTNNVVIISGSIAFNWQVVGGATDYELQIATPSFENATQIVLDSVVSTINFTHTLTANNYEWRVKALNSAYETEYSTNGFVVEAQEP